MVMGNPYRCRVCNNLAGRDGYCTPCRTKAFGKERIPLQRDEFIPTYGKALGKKSFSIFSDKFGIEKDDFDFRKQGLDR